MLIGARPDGRPPGFRCRNAVRLTLISAVLCALLAGCGSGASTAPDTAQTPSAATPTATPVTPRQGGRTSRRRASRTPHTLVSSSADSHTVQPQPPPGSCHARGTGPFSLPDADCTPGAVDPAVTQADLRSTICRSGYTETVRPPESVTEPEKLANMSAYGDSGSPHDYEYDHLVSLELGGARNDTRNLWPEPGTSPNPKDTLENRLHAMVCTGSLTLAAAQLEIATDWVKSYHQLIG
jgi:hypothetical protein